MASHALAIAKATFAATLMKKETTAVSQVDLGNFHQALNALLLHCSTSHIQSCKIWVLQHIVHSSHRAIALGKYLAAVAASLELAADVTNLALDAKTTNPPEWRRQLHLLYFVHDMIHHVDCHAVADGVQSTFKKDLMPYITHIIRSCLKHEDAQLARSKGLVQNILELWQIGQFFDHDWVLALLDEVAKAKGIVAPVVELSLPGQNGSSQSKDDQAFVIPAVHGDISSSPFDLPAANMMPHIRPDRKTPITLQEYQPMQLHSGAARPVLVAAVKELLSSIDADAENSMNSPEYDTDELGERFLRHADEQAIKYRTAYYGWSFGFCERIKQKQDFTDLANWMNPSDTPHV